MTIKSTGSIPMLCGDAVLADPAIGPGALIFLQTITDGNSTPDKAYSATIISGPQSGSVGVRLSGGPGGSGCTVNYLIIQ